MKKVDKKQLRLSIETIRSLDAVEAKGVVGGYIIVSVIKDTAYPYTCPVTVCGCLTFVTIP